MRARLFTFVGGDAGRWRVVGMSTVVGEPLRDVECLEVVAGPAAPAEPRAGWALRGITSNERYTARVEKRRLVARQPELGRGAATCAALIPIRKSGDWWALAQDERRHIFEAQSRHIATGLRYLPAIARRLHHCRDLSEHEPFDFLTWFEYAPEHATAFEQLVAELRASAEWAFVEREVDIRLMREAIAPPGGVS